MRRARRRFVLSAATITAMAGLLGATDEVIQHVRVDARAVEIAARTATENWDLQVQLCQCRGGRWYKGSCLAENP